MALIEFDPDGKSIPGKARMLVGDAVVELSDLRISVSKHDQLSARSVVALDRAKALSAWLKRTRWATAGLIVGATPDGRKVRVARLLDVSTTACCYLDITPELAEIEVVVEYGLRRVMGESFSAPSQTEITWPDKDGWLVALQHMLERCNVGQTDVGFLLMPKSPLAMMMPMSVLRGGGLDRVEFELTRQGIPFARLSRISLVADVLDVEQARLAIERADAIFEP